MRRLLPALALVFLTACGSSSPTDPSGSSSRVIEGQTVSAIDGTVTPNLSVQIGNERATSDGNGMFRVELDPGAYRAVIRGNGVVDRDTTINGPTAQLARLPLIPSAFDLAAFDEMFRTSHDRLQRWTTQPALVVIATVMTYRNNSDGDYVASSEQLSEDEVIQLLEHMTAGLSLLTGNTYQGFASVEVERPAAGTRVNVLRDNRIVVGRYTGIVTLANTIGYGQWSETAEGAITGGAMFLDREFDRNDARRRLLRIHELGHALGYQHVRARTSIMNPAIGPEPTDFDRAAALIAFQRPVGNRAPDTDPSSGTRIFVVAEGGGQWGPPIYCR